MRTARFITHAAARRCLLLGRRFGRPLPNRQPLTQGQDRRFAGIAALGSLLSPSAVSRDPGPGLWVIDASIMPTVVRPTRTLTTIMIAEKLADEIRREAKAGSVEHSALNCRPGANVCIWPFAPVRHPRRQVSYRE